MRRQLRRRREGKREEEQHAGLIPDAIVPERMASHYWRRSCAKCQYKKGSQKPEKKPKPKNTQKTHNKQPTKQKN